VATPLEIRLALRAKGYSPVPCTGKAPCISEWQTKRESSEDEIRAWPGSNTGVLTEDTTTLDIDIDDPDAAQYVEDLVRDMFGEAGTVLVRFGRPPKRAIPLRTTKPFSKIVYRFKDTHGCKHKIEVLGEGQQVIVAGRHPDTKQPYSWHGTDLWNVPHDDLPDTTEDELTEFLTPSRSFSKSTSALCAVLPIQATVQRASPHHTSRSISTASWPQWPSAIFTRRNCVRPPLSCALATVSRKRRQRYWLQPSVWEIRHGTGSRSGARSSGFALTSLRRTRNYPARYRTHCAVPSKLSLQREATRSSAVDETALGA
jgi:hypothetical protein